MTDRPADRHSPATRALALLAALLCLAFSVVAPPSPRGGATPFPAALTSAVIVRAQAGALTEVERSIRLAGGTIGAALPIVNGFAATVPAGRVAALRTLPAVLSIAEDGRATFHSAYDAAADPYSTPSVTAGTGATQAWAAGTTGAGVDVALIDTGVTPVEGLAVAGKLISGPDLTVESQAPNLAHLDGFGHGTFMAGLIAGRDSGANPLSPAGAYLGMAPDARIVSVKVGASDGTVQISQVISGIGWVVLHRHDNGLNIRVLNLSLGTHSALDYASDPLAEAAQAAWQAGIVVVVAGGNDGNAAQRLASPAVSPALIAVGAETAPAYSSLLGAGVAAFSNSGDGIRNPDLVAPGAHLQGLRVPGSFIDQRYPGAVLGTRFFRGSGTSEATALVSGAAALVLQKRPDLRPDDVKYVLTHGAASLAGFTPAQEGAGALQVMSALSGAAGQPVSNSQQYTGDPGLSSIAGQWSTSNGQPAWTGTTWTGTTWTGTTWTGTTWTGTTWTGTTWTGTTWTGTTWTGTTWTGTTWTGTTWTGTTWTGTTWTGTTWTNLLWAGFWGD